MNNSEYFVKLFVGMRIGVFFLIKVEEEYLDVNIVIVNLLFLLIVLK